ncbi:hypothetical protein SEQ_HALENA_94 [Mycobacterium phage Halena]|uniref:Uncharacterized protein n=2 Tax=Mycobacterium virus Bron TaxID=861047 RepID=A0A482JE07_9CAUD|nr:hypothetical protein UPIE_95 [Mycobacterium phage UPIE]AEZ50773.1 hypothetical protein [Mycobacterium phage Fezzik]QBP29876.1 hypothetical protein SEQ_HALENA_94 [Mycobacterium phage Halena]QGJ93115.1 hypothetical protein SEA_ZARIA_97 [Mycobacterium phage Zaria]QOC56761.1 hypothetical protein SEA_TYSON_98 [Mycobacterium phage Tyson]WMI34690.1 hypothetical protein SEA_CALM_98 [Mycobacterium phage Calm]
MSKVAAIRRQELRRSNAAVPHRNRYREWKSGKGQHGEAVAEGVADYGDDGGDDEMSR